MNDNDRKVFILLKIFIIVLISIIITQLTVLFKQNKLYKTVKIGVIDSLIEDDCISKYDIVCNKRIVKDSKINDHGNTILSIIKQENNSQIYYVSTLDSNLVSSIDNIVKAIYWCVDNNVDVINMSFATKEDNILLRRAIKYALDKNIIIVASCINYYDGYSYPANYEGVISVSNEDINEIKIILDKQEYLVKSLDNRLIEVSSTSYVAAYVTKQISNELSGKIKPNLINKIKY